MDEMVLNGIHWGRSKKKEKVPITIAENSFHWNFFSKEWFLRKK